MTAAAARNKEERVKLPIKPIDIGTVELTSR